MVCSLLLAGKCCMWHHRNGMASTKRVLVSFVASELKYGSMPLLLIISVLVQQWLGVPIGYLRMALLHGCEVAFEWRAFIGQSW